MAKKPEEFANPSDLEDFYVRTAEFPAGFMTEYAPSMLIGEADAPGAGHRLPDRQALQVGAGASRVCDANPMHLGHHATADGRWRIYVFADPLRARGRFRRWRELAAVACHLAGVAAARHTPAGLDVDAWFDVKVIYQQDRTRTSTSTPCPRSSSPQVGPFELTDYEKVYGTVSGRRHLRGARTVAATASSWWSARTSTWPTCCR